jgi:hypothetical protein
MPDAEKTYIDLLYHSSGKYAAWDPEIEVKVGDWGYMSKGERSLAFWRRQRGLFKKEGNIYEDGKARIHNISKPIKQAGGQAAKGVQWIVSENVTMVGLSAETTAYVALFILFFFLAIYLFLLKTDTCFR